jgi:hypothetical protein
MPSLPPASPSAQQLEQLPDPALAAALCVGRTARRAEVPRPGVQQAAA